MTKITPSIAKNIIRRALTTILSPEPTKKQIDAMWAHFESKCAYCGIPIKRSSRKGHKDHLVPNGNNHISNRILSCGKCNGDHKRESNWLDYLRYKSPNKRIFLKRKRRIVSWINKNRTTGTDYIDKKLLDKSIDRVNTVFEQTVENLRDSRMHRLRKKPK